MRIATLYILGALFLVGCSSVKNMPAGAHRLDANRVVVEDNRDVRAKELVPYIRQKPNRTSFFGTTRFYLGLYNAAPKCETCWLGRSMRRLGEAPVVFDPDMVEQSNANIRSHLRTRGYYHASVQDTVTFRRHKARVLYTVRPDTVIRIRSVSYNLGRDSLARAVMADAANSLLRSGEPLSIVMMEKERDRLHTLLHNKAFFSFRKDQIAFVVDTIGMHNEADVVMTWSTRPKLEQDMPVHPQYSIRHVNIYSDFDQLRALADTLYSQRYKQTSLPVENAAAGSMNVFYHHSMVLREGVLMRNLMFRPGDAYNETQITQTRDNLVALGVFRMANIQFNEVADTSGIHAVDCIIRLTPSNSQGIKLGLDASVSSNALFGISPSISYFHRNVWGGGEFFNISFSGNFQFSNDKSATELLVAPSLSFPRFFFPWLYHSMHTYKPRSEFTSSFSYQFNPDYTRNALSLSFGYTWRPTNNLSYMLNPVNLNIVHVYNLRPEFYDRLTDPFLRSRYENHFVLGSGFSVIYTDRRPERRVNSVLMRWNVKTAGNLLSAFNSVLDRDETGNYLIGNTPYAQYAKTDINLSYYQYFNENSMLAYRVFGGIGRGYGNSIAMPLEEAYFSGGAYSLRGWQARTLGPGGALPDTIFTIPNQVGDIRLEANVEFRFRIAWLLEGAMFFEGGNIWSLNPADSRDGALFQFNRFYNQIALNSGLGLRLNYRDVFVFRIDWGVRVHDPLPGRGWVRMADWFRGDNSTFHIAIGYPF